MATTAASDTTGAGGRLVGVGVGPGDPELVTLKARRVISESDRVVAPTTSVDSVGRAEAIVRQASPTARIERLVFDMTRPADDPENPPRQSHRRAAAALLAWLDAGEQVAFVTLGDPSMYSTFSTLASCVAEQRPDVSVTTVPGIMAFQALAARAGTVLADGTDALTLVTALDGPADLEAALSRGQDTVVVYKGGRHLPDVAGVLARCGRLDGALLGELLGLPGERVRPVADVADEPASYLATVVVPAVRPPGRR